MSTLQQEIQICFRYPVHFTTALFAPENPLFAQVMEDPETRCRRKVLFVVDEGVNRHHPGLLSAIEAYCRQHRIPLADPPLRVPGGERVKNEHDWVLTVQQAIERAGLCRHSFLAAIGGGAVLDMAGLAGATAHRGVRLIRIPTTVLSQNDSGVGVKNGVNAYGKKNFLGTFAPPYAVVNDSRFLTTLSDRDWRSGIAEAIKVALIKDAAFFEFLEDRAPALASRDMAAMQRLIYRCAELHLQHIATSGDPFELGSARPLDFGHWSAHKLEQLSGYRLRHGEAVAIGLALDTTYSYLSGFIPEADWRRVLGLLLETGFAIHTPELGDYLEARDNPLCLLQGLREFREHLGGELTITLVERIGHGLEVHEIDERLMVESIALLERLGTRFGWDPSDPRPDPAAHPEGTRVPGPPTPSSCRVHVSSEGVAIGHRRRVCRSAERPAGAPPAAGIPAAGVAVCGHPNGTAEKRRIAMENQPAPSPMTRRQLIDEYFIENRTKLLDIAAFLDRLDRAPEDGAETDFRMEAFDEALQVLSEQTVARSTQVQMIFSDPTTEPLDRLDQKSARGAYDRQSGGAR